MKHSIKRLLAALTLATLMALLSGCYVAPGYSYVQGNGAAGDVYYGTGPAVVYNGYYPNYGYYGGYWGGYYGYGCCWRGGGWYGRGGYGRGNPGWHGRGGWSGGHGGWHGGGGHAGGGGHYGGH